MTKLEVLQLLKSHTDFVSGEMLCEQLGLSRNAVWKAVQKLRKEGYQIEAVTNRGYRLRPNQDLLDQSVMQSKRKTAVLGNQLQLIARTSSTNRDVRLQADDPDNHGLVVVTDQQTQGRGKRGGRFYSAQRGLYFSVLWCAHRRVSTLGELRESVLRAIATHLQQRYGIAVEVVLPNELYVDGKKLCGMLTQVSLEAETEEIAYLILGIGLYCNNADFPDEVNGVSLCQLLQGEVDRNQLLCDLLEEIEQNLIAYAEK